MGVLAGCVRVARAWRVKDGSCPWGRLTGHKGRTVSFEVVWTRLLSEFCRVKSLIVEPELCVGKGGGGTLCEGGDGTLCEGGSETLHTDARSSSVEATLILCTAPPITTDAWQLTASLVDR